MKNLWILVIKGITKLYDLSNAIINYDHNFQKDRRSGRYQSKVLSITPCLIKCSTVSDFRVGTQLTLRSSYFKQD